MRRLSGGEGALLGLTALFLCALFVLYGHPEWIAPETEVSVTAASSRASSSRTSSRININTASAAELTDLPGIGETLAGRIVAYRNEHGRFSTPEELKNVKGIGDAKFAAIQERITCD